MNAKFSQTDVLGLLCNSKLEISLSRVYEVWLWVRDSRSIIFVNKRACVAHRERVYLEWLYRVSKIVLLKYS